MTPRVERLKNAILKKRKFEGWFELERIKMESYRKTVGEPQVLRRAKAFKEMALKIPVSIEKGDLIAGSQEDAFATSYDLFKTGLDDFNGYNGYADIYDEVEKVPVELLEEVKSFWLNEDYQSRLANLFTPRENMFMSEAVFFVEPVNGHSIADHGKVLKMGYSGIIEEIKAAKEKNRNDLDRQNCYDAMIIACEAIILLARRYSDLARSQAENEPDPQRKTELLEMARICRKVPEHPAETFSEAIQSFWFQWMGQTIEQNPNPYAFSVGRFDQFMFPYYNRDRERGEITPDRATELIQCLWLKFVVGDRSWAVSQNIILGGVDRKGNDAGNELTLLCIEATADLHVNQPSVSVRYHKNISEKLMNKIVKFIKAGMGMPAIHNDEAVIKSQVISGVCEEDARDYTIAGCQEPVVQGMENARTTATWFNMAKCLELALNNGRSGLTGKQLGPETGDPAAFQSLNDVMRAFETQVDYFIEAMVEAHIKVDRLMAEEKPVPFLSTMFDDCIKKGKDFRDSGARYNFSGCLIHGLANVADSFAALKKLVFEENRLSMADVTQALQNNFAGMEDIRRLLLTGAPKYGNDDKYVDSIAGEVVGMLVKKVTAKKNGVGGSFRAGFSTPSTHVLYGQWVAATPDGRKARETLAYGIDPMQGNNKLGPTATMCSANCFPHWQATHGLAFSQALVPATVAGSEGDKKLQSLIEAYFDLGGYYIYFNVVDPKILRDAQKHPEKYQDLIVRVHGMSARFVTLDPIIQKDIITRAENGL